MASQQTIEFRSSFTRTRTAVNLTVGREYVAGSGDDNEIILQGQDVLGQHAKLTFSPEGLRVEPVKQAPISVNGHAISESTLVLSHHCYVGSQSPYDEFYSLMELKLAKKYIVRLTKDERLYLDDLIHKGKVAAHKRLHAEILLKADISELGAK